MNGDRAGGDARRIMAEFARLTGLGPAGPEPRRYLWTDAFAVCNCLGLSRTSGDTACLELALRLIGQVHQVLGRHRPDDPRRGWISGLGEEEGGRHPTIGGLRIGKRLPGRRRDEPMDERLEWDRDGQYFHYLTKWMHALGQAALATGDATFLRWAMELAATACARFTYVPRRGAGKAMHWKMSIDLSYPLVPSMGQHDPLDGFVTCCALQLAARGFPDPGRFPDLRAGIADLASICRGMDLTTDDPLGTGGLLTDALRIAQVLAQGNEEFLASLGAGLDDWIPVLLGEVLDAALTGLESFADSSAARLPAEYRLAFRELGLSIGLAGVGPLHELIGKNPAFAAAGPSLLGKAEALMPFVPLGKHITGFWSEGRNQAVASWTEHKEINMVMLATSLAPGGFLGIQAG
ncbi:MAG TPA: hypothetical protein VLV30_06475 [Methanomicrobiales archaeon]|nr:hypothetical protein [Methanomicrobiales archaeon]